MIFLKVDFIDDEKLVIYYYYEKIIKSEEEVKVFFELFDKVLKKQYNYEFHGFYNVDIYCKDNLLVLIFDHIDDFSRKDFDVTMFVNSVLLYEFEDADFHPGSKIFYKNKYYIELDDVVDDIRLFELGNIIYGDKVEEILNCGKLISF